MKVIEIGMREDSPDRDHRHQTHSAALNPWGGQGSNHRLLKRVSVMETETLPGTGPELGVNLKTSIPPHSC